MFNGNVPAPCWSQPRKTRWSSSQPNLRIVQEKISRHEVTTERKIQSNEVNNQSTRVDHRSNFEKEFKSYRERIEKFKKYRLQNV